MRLRPLFLALTIAASGSVGSMAHAQEPKSAFAWFQTLCLESGGKPADIASAASRAGWQSAGGTIEMPGATDLIAFRSMDESPKLLLVMTVPGASLDSSASGQMCSVGEPGADQLAMTRTLADWTGFAPEDDGGFKFWAYSTIDGVRVPERGLMTGLPGEELVARVNRRHVSIIGIMPGVTGPTFVSMVPFL